MENIFQSHAVHKRGERNAESHYRELLRFNVRHISSGSARCWSSIFRRRLRLHESSRLCTSRCRAIFQWSLHHLWLVCYLRSVRTLGNLVVTVKFVGTFCVIHFASSPPAALASSAVARIVQGRYPCPPGVVWTLPATCLTTAASSPAPVQEDCARLTLVRFSSGRRAPTSATEPSVQLDRQSGTICRRTPDSQTCHTAVSDSCRRRYYLVSGTKAHSVNFPLTAR